MSYLLVNTIKLIASKFLLNKIKVISNHIPSTTIIAGIFITGLVLVLPITTQAATYIQTSNCSIPMQITNWNINCPINQFDPALGDLQSISVSMHSDINSTAYIESTDPTPISVSAQVSASVTLQRPDNSTLVNTLPLYSANYPLSAFDGIINYSGTSGVTAPNLIASQSDTLITTTASDLALFTGTSTVNLPVVASGIASFNGSANLATLVDTLAASQITVSYSYLAQDLSIGITHPTFFTASTNGTYTLTVTNNESVDSVGTITVIDTLPAGLSFVSNTNPNWTCSAVGQTVTCTSSTIIAGGANSSFDLVVSVDNSTATNITNSATVSSTLVDPVLLNNTANDPTIVNHIPTSSNASLGPVINNSNYQIPANTLTANPNDTGDSIVSYTITTLPNSSLAILYLGNPSSGGTPVTLNQVLTPAQAANLYLQPVSGATGTASFNYIATDSFGAESGSGVVDTQFANPASIPSSTVSSGGNTLLGSVSNNNSTPASSSANLATNPIAVSSLNTEILSNPTNTQKNSSVLGARDSLILNDGVELIRTGGTVFYEFMMNTALLLIVSFVCGFSVFKSLQNN